MTLGCGSVRDTTGFYKCRNRYTTNCMFELTSRKLEIGIGFVGHNATCVWIHVPLQATPVASHCSIVFYKTQPIM